MPQSVLDSEGEPPFGTFPMGWARGGSVCAVVTIEGLKRRTLTKVTRLAWEMPGEPVQRNVGPVHLLYDGGHGLAVAGETDWTLRWTITEPGDRSWLAPYDYDVDGARWVARDASAEEPFSESVGSAFDDWHPRLNELSELVGVELRHGPAWLVLQVSGGEVTT